MSSHQINISQATLDPDTCRRARISRDPRFDGEFFLGVSTPGQLRKHQRVSRPGAGIRLQLQYRPPYDWEGVLNLFRRHALAGVEEVTDSSYQRSFDSSDQPANFTVTRARGRNALDVRLQLPQNTHLMPVVARIRRMFDLDANPAAISQVLGQSEPLRTLLEQHPGIRAPVHFSPFESAIRAVVGQQVSVAAARNVCARLADACKTQCIGFPTAAALACLADEHFSMPTRRRDTLRTLCSHYTNAEQSLDMETLASFKGIGPWTCTMVAMRGFGDPDVFALGDLGLQQAWSACFVDSDEEDLASAVTHWRPWRSYAANLLWRSLGS